MTTTPRIYVSTYAKYAAGSLSGQWLNVSDYSDRGAFLAACRALHCDEADPELMFQDHDDFPASFITESTVDPALWDWLELDGYGRRLLAAFRDGVDPNGTYADAQDSFMGTADTKAGFAEQFLHDTGALESIPEQYRAYFDYEAYARDMELGGDVYFVRIDGDLFAFSANY